jgi:hypothetical protein
MDHELHEAHESFRRRFQALAAEADRLHEAWREAVDRRDIDLQARLIAREHGILTELSSVITAFQQSVLQRHRLGEVPPSAITRPAEGGQHSPPE